MTADTSTVTEPASTDVRRVVNDCDALLPDATPANDFVPNALVIATPTADGSAFDAVTNTNAFPAVHRIDATADTCRF